MESIQLRAVSYSVMKRLNSIVSPPPASNKRKNCESKSTGLELLSSDEVEFLRLYQIELAKKTLPPAEANHEIERKESMRLLQLDYLRKASSVTSDELKGLAGSIGSQKEDLLMTYSIVPIPKTIADKAYEAVEIGKFPVKDVCKYYEISRSSVQRIMIKKLAGVKGKYKNIKEFEARNNASWH